MGERFTNLIDDLKLVAGMAALAGVFGFIGAENDTATQTGAIESCQTECVEQVQLNPLELALGSGAMAGAFTGAAIVYSRRPESKPQPEQKAAPVGMKLRANAHAVAA